MPPNRKFPLNLEALSQLDFETSENTSDHAQPLASSADVIDIQSNATTVAIIPENDGDDYFHHDIEANPEVGNDSTKQKPELDQSTDKDTNHLVRATLKEYSTLVQDPTELTVDEERLQRSLHDAGSYGYGLQGIAVWLFSDENDRLISPPGGFWYSNSNIEPSTELRAVVDTTSPEHIPMDPVPPGTDIAGLLWLESSNQIHPRRLSSFFMRRTGSSAQIVPHRASTHSFASLVEDNSLCTNSIVWRDLKSLVDDPDTSKGPRMSLLHKAGFGQAAGIPFQAGVTSGMIIFFAQRDLDPGILNGTANISYLRHAAQFVGSAAAMSETRRATIGHQLEKQGNRDYDTTCPLKKKDISNEEHSDMQRKMTKEDSEDLKQTHFSHCCTPTRLKVWINKLKGGSLQVPPALSLSQSLWTALGAFCGLLVLSSLNEYYQIVSDDDYFLLIGPFGALMTLQYGLTAAPASQPRNAVMGQAVAGAISLAFTYIPTSILPVWLRQAIGPAVGIATMVKFGFTHPPAGAHAVLYASGKYNFAFYAIVVFSTIISIIPATLVNNLSRKRQYPTYWGFPAFCSQWANRKKDDE